MTDGKKIAKTMLKILLSIVAFYSLCCMVTLTSCSKTNVSNNGDDYETYIKEIPFANKNLPSLKEMGNYEQILIGRKSKKYILWNVETISIKVVYSKEAFEEVLKIIEDKYSYLSETKEYLHDYYAKEKGYEIKVVEKNEIHKDEDFYDYPKAFMMVGINEESNSILYLFHYHYDLDEIKDLDSFIKKNYILN